MSQLTKIVAHEWCRPDFYYEGTRPIDDQLSQTIPYGKLVSMPTANGWIILTEVREVIATGELIRRALTYDELQVVSQ
jgi:hypothetical protein